MQIVPQERGTDPPLLVCSYEDRPESMDAMILMAESLCRVDPLVTLHLTVPRAPASVRDWAERRPQVVLSTQPPQDVAGWDVKGWLLLEQLEAGRPEAIWIDSDMIITRPISRLLQEFPRDSLIVTEDWDAPRAMRVGHLWGLPSGRLIERVNGCFVRATQAHRRLLARWFELVHDPDYRRAQTLPFQSRPLHLKSDDWLLTALLESEEFGRVRYDRLRLGRHIAQCAGSSGYRVRHRLLDLVRGLPPLVHCIGRKPWCSSPVGNRFQRFLLDLANDVSPYVLAARRVAVELGMNRPWLEPQTVPGAVLRRATAGHPGMAGLPLAALHAVQQKVVRATTSAQRPEPVQLSRSTAFSPNGGERAEPVCTQRKSS
jgi:hypothetical protein